MSKKNKDLEIMLFNAVDGPTFRIRNSNTQMDYFDSNIFTFYLTAINTAIEFEVGIIFMDLEIEKLFNKVTKVGNKSLAILKEFEQIMVSV